VRRFAVLVLFYTRYWTLCFISGTTGVLISHTRSISAFWDIDYRVRDLREIAAILDISFNHKANS